MKTELRLASHSELPDANVIEIWHDGNFIGTVAGADNTGVRIITKYPVSVKKELSFLSVVTVTIDY